MANIQGICRADREKDIFYWVGEHLKLEMNRDSTLGSCNTVFTEVGAELCFMRVAQGERGNIQ